MKIYLEINYLPREIKSPTQSQHSPPDITFAALVLSYPQQLSVVDAMLQGRIGRCRKFRISGELNSQLFPISPEF